MSEAASWFDEQKDITIVLLHVDLSPHCPKVNVVLPSLTTCAEKCTKIDHFLSFRGLATLSVLQMD